MANVVVEAQYIADTTRYVRSVRQATDETARFASAVPQAVQATDQLKSSSIGLSAALGTVGAILGAKALGAVQKYAMQGIAAAKQYEQTVISIEGIFAGTGMSMEAAADKTKSYLADLRDFAARTPFELPQVLDAVKRLLSIGYAADDVKNRMLPAIGDIVAALGQPPSAVSAVVYAFGQMKSAGRVLSQDLMQIGNALPGFNAKMALASKLFQGDMFALTKAMESGSLDSSKAIDVLIQAMTEFGGAAGAMDRQSKTLTGVLSTFADTVNNALIDGLMPSLPVLSKTLNDVMPQVQNLAQAFAQALGPSLVSGAETVGKLAPIVTEVLPPIIKMAQNLTSLADVVVTLAPLLQLAANAVGVIANAMESLPAPVYAAIAALLAMRALMKKFGMDAAQASGAATGAFAKMAAQVRGAMTTTTTSIQLGIGEFRRLAAAAEQAAVGVSGAGVQIKAAMAGVRATASLMGTSFVGTLRAMGVAVKGFMAAIGPVGWAIAAVSVAFEVMGGKSAEAQGLIEKLKATVDETTGAFGELTAATIANQLRTDISPEDQAALAGMGITIADMTRAVMEGGPAVDAMNQKFADLTWSADNLKGALGMGPHLQTVQRNFQGLVVTMEDAKVSMDAEAKSAAEAAAITGESAKAALAVQLQTAASAAAASRNLAAKRQADYAAMSEAEKRAALQTAISAGIQANAEQKLAAATSALTDWFNKSRDAFQKLNDALSAEATMDAARRSVLDLKKSLEDNGKTLSEHTEKGLANRAAVRDVIKSYAEWAAATNDPIEQQKRLQEGEDALRKQLGKKFDKSEIVRAFETAKTETKQYADEWKKAASDAKAAGDDVGKNFIDGIINKLREDKGKVSTAAAEIGQTLPDSANAAQGAQSPAKEGIKVGKNFIDGIVIGLDKLGLVRGKGSAIGSSIVDSVRSTLSAGGSVTDMLSGMLGGLPSIPTPLEVMLGGSDKVEAWKKKHHKQLVELARMAQEIDDAMAQIRSAGEAIGSMNAALSRTTGTYNGATVSAPSALEQAIGSKGSLDSAMSMFDSLTSALDQGYQARIALTKKGERAAVEAERAGAMAQAEAYRSEVAGYMIRKQQIEAQLSDLEKSYSKQVSDINAHYDALDKAAEQALRATEAKWDGIIKNLESQLAAANAAFDKENQVLQGLIQERDAFLSRIAEGFRSYAGEIGRDGGSFADSFEQRLKDVQAFSQNIKTLVARGLDPSIVRDFVQAGVSGAGGAAADLAAASDDEIARINSAQMGLGAAISEFQAYATQQWFAAGIAQQQAIVAPLATAAAQAQEQLLLANQMREQEIAAARAYQEQLRADREAALKAAQETYLAEKDRLDKETDEINKKLDARADSILVYFLGLKEVMQQKMLDLGKKIADKMIEGLAARERALYDKARAMVAEVVNIVKGLLGISSPSDVMMNVGEMMAAGMAIGMENGVGQIKAAARALTKAGTAVDVGVLSPAGVKAELSNVAYTGGHVAGLSPTEVTVAPGAVQITFPTGTMDNMTAEQIQAIVDEAMLKLAREIRRT